jgi:predicted CxxxxCH...CXXCH cytochrome family protein
MKQAAVIATVLCMAIYCGSAARGAATADSLTVAQQASVKQALYTCAACHGTNGRSISPTFPDLAGQSAQYIELQLHAFKDQSRADPDAQAYMWGMAARLDDALIKALAQYFATQPVAAGAPGDAALLAEGKRIYSMGIPARQVPPCNTCHGAHGEGIGPFPRLAGQHAPYLLKQLLVIQSVLRTAPVMHGVIKDLNTNQMNAVATYLQTL